MPQHSVRTVRSGRPVKLLPRGRSQYTKFMAAETGSTRRCGGRGERASARGQVCAQKRANEAREEKRLRGAETTLAGAAGFDEPVKRGAIGGVSTSSSGVPWGQREKCRGRRQASWWGRQRSQSPRAISAALSPAGARPVFPAGRTATRVLLESHTERNFTLIDHGRPLASSTISGHSLPPTVGDLPSSLTVACRSVATISRRKIL